MLIALLDKKGKIEKKKPKFVRQDDAVIVRLEVQSGAVCLELFKDYAQLGRFTLRDKGMWMAVIVFVWRAMAGQSCLLL
jgi:translation elongation factor EF-1alpha